MPLIIHHRFAKITLLESPSYQEPDAPFYRGEEVAFKQSKRYTAIKHASQLL
jgi:hypothetical protein